MDSTFAKIVVISYGKLEKGTRKKRNQEEF